MSSISVSCCVCLLVSVAWMAEVAAGRTIFNVLEAGAVADGKTDNSKIFLDAFRKACQTGGESVVLIPAGRYVVGPTEFRGPCQGPLRFLIKGDLIARTDPASSLDTRTWITFQYMNQLVVGGGGTLDGQGPSAWHYRSCVRSSSCPFLPYSLALNFVNNSLITRINSINSKGVHMNVFACSGVNFDKVHISAPGDSPNTDGIHIGKSSSIHISNSVIATGDDCVSMSPGSTNINIANVQCGPGHGISIGSLGRGPNEQGVSGVAVTNSTFIGTQNGLRIKTWASSFASNVFNLTFEHITMKNVQNPIIIDQKYCPSGYCRKGNSHVQIRDVKFRNVHGTSSSEVAVALTCSASKPCKGILLDEINLVSVGNGGPTVSLCENANGVSVDPQHPTSCL